MFTLPQEIQGLIYQYDPTYKDKYTDIIKAFDYENVINTENGLLVCRINKLFGHYIYYNERRQVILDYYLKNKVFHGCMKSFYYPNRDEQCVCLKEQNFKNGKPDGICKDFFLDGTLKTLKNFENGKLEGEVLNYYHGGILFSKTNYENGKRNGPYLSFHKNGTKKRICIFKNDKSYANKFF